MRVLVGILGILILIGAAFHYGETVNDSLNRTYVKPGHKSSETPSRTQETDFEIVVNNLGKAFKFMLGIEKREEKSDLQKLLQQRRRDTNVFQRFDDAVRTFP